MKATTLENRLSKISISKSAKATHLQSKLYQEQKRLDHVIQAVSVDFAQIKTIRH